jgi:hypothetical protein
MHFALLANILVSIVGVSTEKSGMSPFPPIALQSSLTIEAILFGVFGFLYSVYALYSNPSSIADLERPPIVAQIKVVCQIIAGLIMFSALLTIISLVLMYFSGGLSGPAEIILGALFAFIMIAIAIISGVWVFRYME